MLPSLTVEENRPQEESPTAAEAQGENQKSFLIMLGDKVANFLLVTLAVAIAVNHFSVASWSLYIAAGAFCIFLLWRTRNRRNIRFVVIPLCALLTLGTHLYVRSENSKSASHLHLSDRPFMRVTKLELSELIVGKPAITHTVFENMGKTPAYECLASVAVYPTGTPFTNTPANMPRPRGPPSPKQTVAPGQKFEFTTPSDELGEAEITMVKKMETLLYVFGTCTYFDEWKHAHTFQFCGLYSPTTDNFKMQPFHYRDD